MKRIYILILMSILSLNLISQVQWTKFESNPVVVPGSFGEWDQIMIAPGSVLYVGDTYHMWYWGGNLLTQDFGIGHATSPDGVIWTKDTMNPVILKGPAGDWDDHFVHEPIVLFNDTIYHMWYTGHTGTDLSKDTRVGHATSLDGITWLKDTVNNPVLDLGSGGAWDAGWIAAGSVIYDGNEYHMWYSAFDGVIYPVRVGHATSPDGVKWTKDPSNPVMTTGAGSWDNPRIDYPKVVKDGSAYHMWYSGGEYLAWDIGYATSEDGINWVMDPDDNPVLARGPAGSWDQQTIDLPVVIYDSTNFKYKLWYGGVSQTGMGGIGYAESRISPRAWEQMKSMDIEKGLPVSAGMGHKIYVFGGVDNSLATLSSATVYNSATNQWSDLASMKEDLYGSTSGIINGNIYLAGGWRNLGNENWVVTNSNMEYNPGEDIWQEKTDCPELLGGNVSSVLNDTLYIPGGNLLNQKKSWYYVPGTDSWGSLPDMIYDRPGGHTADLLENKIYVIGGTYGSDWDNPMGKSEVYDLKSKTWVEIADMPVPVICHISVVHDQKILVFGGDSSLNMDIGAWGTSIGTDFIQEYDPSTDSWRLMKGMPFKRASMAGEKVGNFVYLIGGYLNSRDLDEALSEVWRFDLDSLEAGMFEVTGVKLGKKTLELEVGATDTLRATVYPTYATDRSVTWTSVNPGIATVTNEGIVEGVAVGVTEIVVTTDDGQFKDTCIVSMPVGFTRVSADHVSIYPNPAGDLVTVRSTFSDDYAMEIISSNGQMVQNITFTGSEYHLDLSAYPKGVYFIRIRTINSVVTEKIVKM